MALGGTELPRPRPTHSSRHEAHDPTVSDALVQGGAAAVAATDPPIRVARRRLIRAVNRRARRAAARSNAVISANAEQSVRRMFAAYGTTLPPDATFTLRITTAS